MDSRSAFYALRHVLYSFWYSPKIYWVAATSRGELEPRIPYVKSHTIAMIESISFRKPKGFEKQNLINRT